MSGLWNKAVGALLLSLAAATPALAQTEKPIKLIVFPGGFNWPIWVAQDQHFFKKNNIAVKITLTPSSVFQLTSLID